jgi:hypothetical protein
MFNNFSLLALLSIINVTGFSQEYTENSLSNAINAYSAEKDAIMGDDLFTSNDA